MTQGQRVLNAVNPRAEVLRMNDKELTELLEELGDRTWWNEFWEILCGWATGEAIRRWMASGNTKTFGKEPG